MKSNYKPLIVAVFLVIVGLVSGNRYSLKISNIEVKVAHYSPALIGVAQAESGVTADSAALVQGEGEGMVVSDAINRESNISQLAISVPVTSATNGTAIQDPGQPIGQSIDPSSALQYEVKKGDTLSDIAVHFDIPAATILSANPNIRKGSLQVGIMLTIPGQGSNNAESVDSASALPNFNGDFILPAQGDDYGVLDSNNGVEIINSCGTPVVAAADGVVVPDNNIAVTAGGWNNGYGNFVLVEHPFGSNIFTRYAHLQQSLVKIGDYVKQGQQIGLIGQSGGASVCGLDFEVVGAQNPFAK